MTNRPMATWVDADGVIHTSQAEIDAWLAEVEAEAEQYRRRQRHEARRHPLRHAIRAGARWVLRDGLERP